MKILFFGNASFGIPTLEKLVRSNHQVISVVTNKDKKAGRGNLYQSTPIKKWSNQNNVSTLEENNLSSIEFTDKIKTLNPDLIVNTETINVSASVEYLYQFIIPSYHSNLNINCMKHIIPVG